MNLEELATELGIDKMPQEEREVFMAQIEDTLEKRVGMHFAEHMTDAEMEEFNSVIDKDPDQAMEWLMQKFPDYVQVVQEQILIIKDDIKSLLPPKQS